MKLSVILPSLNVAQYIRECIESVIHQSLQEIEIICVDAGSTDGTLDILEEYAKKDKRIKLILSERKSYGYQMNLGIDTASGKYIGIVETDDYVPEGMYKELYRIAEENNVDFVKADFYRFTGEGEELQKIFCPLTQNFTFYNRIINTREEQECFKFEMNTWSGIYRKDFLTTHNIRHNETSGASFQDTGFWFQTFLYAKRAFFLNKPYYMNRRDNPGSSVYSRQKAFSLCDEYKYIEGILRKDSSIFQEMKDTYAYLCFLAYKGTLYRVEEEYQKLVLRRFTEEFCKFRSEGMLDRQLFSDKDWNMLLSIMDNPEQFYQKNILVRQKVLDEIRKQERIIIYGAGVVGKHMLIKLKYVVKLKNILCFAVSHKEGNPLSYQGVPVFEIHDLLKYRRNSLVIIATGRDYQQEIYMTLKKLEFDYILLGLEDY